MGIEASTHLKNLKREAPSNTSYESSSKLKEKIPYIFFIFFVLLWNLMGFHYSHGPMGSVVDDGEYFIGAESIANGEGYKLTSRFSDQATKYPIGVSFLSSIGLTLLPDNASLDSKIQVVKLLTRLAANGFYIACCFWLIKIGLSSWVAVMSTLIAMFNNTVIVSSSSLLAEVYFGASVFLCFLWWQIVKI